MKISKAFKEAWEAYTRHFGDTIRFLVTEGCLGAICCAPALFLLVEGMAPLALLSLPLFLLMLLPARMNAAEAMAEALDGGRLFSLRLADPTGYGRKLWAGLKRAFFVLLWSAPLIASAILIRNHISGDMDGFTLMRMIRSDFGDGDLVTGVVRIGIVVLAAALLMVLGVAFHSGARHALARGDGNMLKGHHGQVLGAWFVALVALLPLLIAVVAAVIRYLPALGDLNGLFMGDVNLPSTRGTLILLGAGALLTLPLLPLRSLMIAALVGQLGHPKGDPEA